MKEISLTEEFNCTAKQFFQILFDDNSTYKSEFHVLRGDSDLKLTPWEPSSHGKYQRVARFHSMTSNNAMIKKIAGAHVDVEETAYYYYPTERELVIETVSKVLSPMSEGFLTTAKWTIIDYIQTCRCSISVMNEYKGTWFKGTVEGFIAQQSQAAYEQYLRLAREKIEEYNRKMLSVSVPPVEHREREQTQQEFVREVAEVPVIRQEPKKILKTVRYDSSGYSSEGESSNYNTDDEFYDAESFSDVSGNATVEIYRELANLKSIIESTHTRLLGLEAAFINLQEKYIPITSKSQNVRQRLNTYFTRLDSLMLTNNGNNNNNTSSSPSDKKLEDIDKKLNIISTSFSIMKGITLIAFLMLWPPIANQTWKFVRNFMESRLLKK